MYTTLTLGYRESELIKMWETNDHINLYQVSNTPKIINLTVFYVLATTAISFMLFGWLLECE